ncbi:hypothetical protein LCGC14_2695370 [marine sediment metagenome]|uniref:Glycosyl transferase family 1 domain-containing protein n=1 Tax=marine sediment metagenome TaxID=412755 RepID=A0A0F9A4V2_9ZZZZ
MRIVFNVLKVGLGNNGGSKTLVRCAEILKELGNDVVIASQGNNYTWNKIKVPIVSSLPKADVVVATGFGSVKSTVQSSIPKKFYYIRGFEIWRASEKQLLNSFKSLRCIVNSEWLYPCDIPVVGREDVVGGLFHTKHKTKRHDDVVYIAHRLGVRCVMLNRDIKNPKPGELSKFYNSIKVWISPSELEGLHNCPMEASLCGCGLVATDHAKGGTLDYAIHEETCLRYESRDLDMATSYVEKLLRDNSEREKLQSDIKKVFYNKIGSKMYNMTKMAGILQS